MRMIVDFARVDFIWDGHKVMVTGLKTSRARPETSLVLCVPEAAGLKRDGFAHIWSLARRNVIGDRAHMVRTGIDIGGTSIKIGLAYAGRRTLYQRKARCATPEAYRVVCDSLEEIVASRSGVVE